MSLRDEVTDLLCRLIRVDTTNPPGNETAAAELLRGYLEANGVGCELYARVPERASLVARIPGRGDGPSLLLLCHTDVVLADPAEWTVPPFAGEVRDGEVWGRGALDMKGQVAASAVADRLARPRGLPAGRRPDLRRHRRRGGRRRLRTLLALRGAPRRRPLRLRDQRGRRRPARARQRRLPLRDGREEDGAVPDPRSRPLRPRVDAGDRRQRAREGGTADRAPGRVPAGAAATAGGRGVPACSARRGAVARIGTRARPGLCIRRPPS